MLNIFSWSLINKFLITSNESHNKRKRKKTKFQSNYAIMLLLLNSKKGKNDELLWYFLLDIHQILTDIKISRHNICKYIYIY
jgi:hypothetical protein